MVDIKKVVDEMLKEEIGKHMCDSGGAYGYQYEKNREKGYLKGLCKVDEYTNKEAGERTLEVTIPVYDLLTYNLLYDEDALCKEKQLYCKLKKQEINPYSIWEVKEVIENTFSKGIMPIDWINTYNYEEYVSQTLQFCPFKSDGEDYILLQVHNGCDVRSGYTKPRVFKVKDITYFLAGLNDRKTECKCGLNDYNLYGYDEIYDTSGWKMDKGLIYDRTYLDTKGNVRCRDCDSLIKGGFIEW